jgi:hypothetical protein
MTRWSARTLAFLVAFSVATPAAAQWCDFDISVYTSGGLGVYYPNGDRELHFWGSGYDYSDCGLMCYHAEYLDVIVERTTGYTAAHVYVEGNQIASSAPVASAAMYRIETYYTIWCACMGTFVATGYAQAEVQVPPSPQCVTPTLLPNRGMHAMKTCYLIAVALVLGVTVTAQVETRRFVWNGRAITSELRADDRHVEIETSDSPPAVGQRPAGMSQVEAVATGTDLMAVGHVEAAEPILLFAKAGVMYPATAETASWIDSLVTIRLTRVIKDTGFRVSAGSRVQFRQKGGRARIEGVLVDALVPWRMPLLEGKTYLILGLHHEGRYVHIGAYEMDDARRLRKMASQVTNPRTGSRFPVPEPVSIDEFELWGADATFGYLEDEVRRQAAEKGTTTTR